MCSEWVVSVVCLVRCVWPSWLKTNVSSQGPRGSIFSPKYWESRVKICLPVSQYFLSKALIHEFTLPSYSPSSVIIPLGTFPRSFLLCHWKLNVNLILSPFYLNIITITYFLGDLNCETCTTTRGALVGLVMGGLYPILLAIPVNGGLAAR